MNNFADLLIKERAYSRALSLSTEALRLDPDSVDARIMVGVVLEQAGRLKEAEAFFLEALKIKPDSISAMRNLGSFYGNMGDFDRAILIWQKALSLNPSDKALRDNLDEAKRLKNKALK